MYLFIFQVVALMQKGSRKKKAITSEGCLSIGNIIIITLVNSNFFSVILYLHIFIIYPTSKVFLMMKSSKIGIELSAFFEGVNIVLTQMKIPISIKVRLKQALGTCEGYIIFFRQNFFFF